MASMEEPKLKKAKTAVKEEQQDEDDEENEVDAEGDQSEDEQVQIMERNENGESFCELSRTRRLTVRKFKSAVLVDIREYYEKGDKMLPGKKGISLSIQQFEALKKAITSGAIDRAIREL